MMKRNWLGVGAALVLGGCASVEMAQYTVTSFPEIPLKDNAKVIIVAGNEDLSDVALSLRKGFAKSGSFVVVEDKADYWFVLNGVTQYRQSEPQRVVSVVKQENSGGGREVLAVTPHHLASAAKGVSVAVYEANTLSPVHYFEIPIYSGDNTKEAVRSAKAYDAAFKREVVGRVRDAFITQQKQVRTPVPLEADGSLRELFAKCGKEFAQGNTQAYEPFKRKYEQLGKVDLPKFCEQLRTKTYEGSDADMKLGNYYLHLLVEEALTQDPDALKSIRDEQAMILRASEAKGLAEAVPVALARLEYKLEHLGD